MSGKGIMHGVQSLVFASLLAIIVPAVFAQAPANRSDDLDVTMRVIVDPNAKVPDEIVRRIQLPKPAQPATPSNKPAEPGAQGKERASEAREQGRDFGQQTSEEARRRAEEARRNKPPPPGTPGTPGPPRQPPGRPNTPPPGG
jgi:hypothetical protein